MALLVLGSLVAIVIFVPGNSAQVSASARSPDGSTEAVLVAIRPDRAGAHNYKVCFRRPGAAPLNTITCREVAYLGGVADGRDAEPVSLVWTNPSQLEIRYVSAARVYVYVPVFIWGSPRMNRTTGPYLFPLPIVVKAVPVGVASQGAPHGAH